MNDALLILAGLVLAPFVLLLSVKLSVYGFYKGRQLFLDEQKERESNG